MDSLAEVFHSPGMKALFFRIGELVNSVHATAVLTKGSGAAGGYAGWHSPSRTGQKNIALRNAYEELLKSTLSFQNLT